MTLRPDVQACANLLHEIEAILTEHKQTFWASKIASCLVSIQKSDAYGLHQFLSFFGGMGSLNDVVLSRENDRLRTLLTCAYEAGRHLERDG
jgi:hypothetical protein